jgi:hypothetical protein
LTQLSNKLRAAFDRLYVWFPQCLRVYIRHAPTIRAFVLRSSKLRYPTAPTATPRREGQRQWRNKHSSRFRASGINLLLTQKEESRLTGQTAWAELQRRRASPSGGLSRASHPTISSNEIHAVPRLRFQGRTPIEPRNTSESRTRVGGIEMFRKHLLGNVT